MLYALVLVPAVLALVTLVFLVVFELKNKPVKWRITLLAIFVLLSIIVSFFYMQYRVFGAYIYAGFHASSAKQETLTKVGKADRKLLTGINAYLSSGKSAELLEAKIAGLLAESAEFFKPSLSDPDPGLLSCLFPEYDYEKHIKAFNELGDELELLSEKE